MNVRDHGAELRMQAIGMLNAGMTHKEKFGESQKTKSRSGRYSTVKKVAKIMISKSLGKRGKSTRKLARIVSDRGYPISHSTVYRYLRNSLVVRSFKRPKIPRLSAKMKENCLKFAKFRFAKNGLLKIGNAFCGPTKHPFNCSIPQIDKMIVFGLGIQLSLILVFKSNFLEKLTSGA